SRGRLGRIPLVLNMPVLISQNLDVELGVVNGSVGYVRSIRFYRDGKGRRRLSCVIVEVPDAKNAAIDGLPPNHFPVAVDTIDLKLRNK
ncbi:hypothetical protein BDN72DRAFT_721349, partial [Pluteus cervinus]